MAVYHSIWRRLYDSLHAAQKPKSKLIFVTLDKGSNISMLRLREEFLKICSEEDLQELKVKKSQERRSNS